MKIDFALNSDIDEWLMLTKEVEPLFGPMCDDINFINAVKKAISDKQAITLKSENRLCAGVVISKESNEIVWLAVTKQDQNKGYGKAVLKFALDHLDKKKDILVETFDKSEKQGQAARKLYLDIGFIDHKQGSINPAGFKTIIMKLNKSEI